MVLESDDDGALEISDDDVWPSDSEAEETAAPNDGIHPRDLENFAKLCAALKILLADELTENDVSKADAPLRDYCTELIEVRTVAGATYSDIHLTVIDPTFSAVWAWGHAAKSPLLDAYRRLHTRLWAVARVLDVHIRAYQQDPQELQDIKP